jgi:cephalosporin hydroxylase
MRTFEELDDIWERSLKDFKIQQIKDEWIWLINNTVNKWEERGNILEIGAYDGGSSNFLGHFAKSMITIDNNIPCRFNPNHIPAWKYQYIGGDSHHPKQTELFSKYEWDFAFIDGDHSYEGVKADFYNLLPHLKKGTPVAFHDIAISDFHHQHGCYVGEFWRDLKKEYKATEFMEMQVNPDWAGVGIVII